MTDKNFSSLVNYLKKVPSIKSSIAMGVHQKGYWWIKFQIDINNKFAWRVIQEIACVTNYISLDERLPTIFYPVSPAPYLNGGPKDFLWWMIENTEKDFTPENLREWLEGRLPDPVDDLEQWDLEG